MIPLMRAKALGAAAEHFLRADDRSDARAAFTGAVEVYASLGAAADVARLEAAFRAHGIRRGPGDAEHAARAGPLDYERGGGDRGTPRVHPRCTPGHGPGWDAG